MKITEEKGKSISRFAEILDSLPERYVELAYVPEIAQASGREARKKHSGRGKAAFRTALIAVACLAALTALVVGTALVSARLHGGAGAGSNAPVNEESVENTEAPMAPITLTFDAAGGTGCLESITVAYGETPKLPVPTRAGHWFLGWDFIGNNEAPFQIRFLYEEPEAFRDYQLTAVWLDYDPHGTVRFGHFEQDGSKENGAEPLEWYILDHSDGKVLLLSKYVIAAMPYNAMIGTGDGRQANFLPYGQSDLRAWLLGEFADAAFSEDEKARLISAPVDGSDNPDNVFLLSVSEMKQYCWLWRENEISAPATKAALAAGLRLENQKGGQEYCWWWLRQEAADINGSRYGYVSFPAAGTVGGFAASNSPSSLYGVRPAILVDEAALGDVFTAE